MVEICEFSVERFVVSMMKETRREEKCGRFGAVQDFYISPISPEGGVVLLQNINKTEFTQRRKAFAELHQCEQLPRHFNTVRNWRSVGAKAISQPLSEGRMGHLPP